MYGEDPIVSYSSRCLLLGVGMFANFPMAPSSRDWKAFGGVRLNEGYCQGFSTMKDCQARSMVVTGSLIIGTGSLPLLTLNNGSDFPSCWLSLGVSLIGVFFIALTRTNWRVGSPPWATLAQCMQRRGGPWLGVLLLR